MGAERGDFIFDLPESRYAPGYLLLDGQLALASTEDALAGLAAVAQQPAGALAAEGEHRQSVQQLTERRELLAYIDLRSARNRRAA